MKVVVTGAVDSGKSTLIGRFLYELGTVAEGLIGEIEDSCRALGRDFEFAYLLDSFWEERQGELTIDTTEAFCRTEAGRAFVFIDVPGHKELVRNMLCGSSYADIAILIIDVQKPIIDEGTKSHAFILSFLGIEEIILALNKMDLVGFREDIFENIKRESVGFLKEVQIRPHYFIPICAKNGGNLLKRSPEMPWYKGPTLVEALNNCTKRESGGALRFPIQDIYEVKGERAAVGRISVGRIRKGETVRVLPLNEELEVKSIRIFDKTKSVAEAPEGIGLVLSEMNHLRRGHVVCNRPFPRVSSRISAKIFCVRDIKAGERLMFRCATQEAPARIERINGARGTALPAGSIAEVVIYTEAPLATDKFVGTNSLGRFVLKMAQEICAAGVVT